MVNNAIDVDLMILLPMLLCMLRSNVGVVVHFPINMVTLISYVFGMLNVSPIDNHCSMLLHIITT